MLSRVTVVLYEVDNELRRIISTAQTFKVLRDDLRRKDGYLPAEFQIFVKEELDDQSIVWLPEKSFDDDVLPPPRMDFKNVPIFYIRIKTPSTPSQHCLPPPGQRRKTIGPWG